MNFYQDYENFIKHTKVSGKTGAVEFSRKEDVAIRFFLAYLNCVYRRQDTYPGGEADAESRCIPGCVNELGDLVCRVCKYN